MQPDRIRKQQYYPRNPERNDYYKTSTRKESHRNSSSRENDFNQLQQSRYSNTQSQYDNQTYLPPIRSGSTQNNYNQSIGRSSRAEQDRTQIYLKNCQYIAKNLRELKQKKQKDHYQTLQIEPSPKGECQKKLSYRKDIQFYPKNPYASNKTKNYNISVPKKTFDSYNNKKQQVNPQSRSEREIDSQQDDSETPNQRRKQAKKFSKLSSNRVSNRNSPQVVRKYDMQKYKGQQNAKIQKQLITCLSEMTHLLKHQNENKQAKKEETSSKNKNRKHYIPSQSESEKSARNHKIEEKYKTQRQQSLKYKTIIALKKLNKRSKKLMKVASSHIQQIKPKQNQQTNKKRGSVKFAEDVEVISPTRKQILQRNNSSKRIKPILSIPVNLKISPSQKRSNSRLSTSNNPKQNLRNTLIATPRSTANETLNSQLGRQLVSFLQKQQDQNLELSNCLKQMTDYLKIHNEQIAQLRNSRLQQKKSPKKNQLTQKQKQKLMQKAVVKNLKNARLRGNVFKEKVEKYINEHDLTLKKKSPQPNYGQDKQPAIKQQQGVQGPKI